MPWRSFYVLARNAASIFKLRTKEIEVPCLQYAGSCLCSFCPISASTEIVILYTSRFEFFLFVIRSQQKRCKFVGLISEPLEVSFVGLAPFWWLDTSVLEGRAASKFRVDTFSSPWEPQNLASCILVRRP